MIPSTPASEGKQPFPSHPPGFHARSLFLVWLAFLLYGSLLPFELRDIGFAEAVEQFTRIRYLDLGAASRADWIANILLYIPLAWLGLDWMSRHSRPSFATRISVLALCTSIALGIEFLQTFFAPRTVSLNDLIAEFIGSLLGIVLWHRCRDFLHDLLRTARAGRQNALNAAINLYVVAYLLLSLFPYDLLVSWQEFQDKLASPQVGWLVAGVCQSRVRCLASLGAEALALMPLGLLVTLARPDTDLRRLTLFGLGAGLLLEALQLSLYSGVSQGISILTRPAGLLLGATAGYWLRRRTRLRIATTVWRLGGPLLFPWALGVLALNGVLKTPDLPLGMAWERLQEVRLLPFYHHYFTTETHAVASLLAQFCMYAPLGLLAWSQRARRGKLHRPCRSLALVGVVAALPVELGKLFYSGLHPDLTNLLIAATAVAVTCRTLDWLITLTHARQDTPPVPPSPRGRPHRSKHLFPHLRHPSRPWLLTALFSLPLLAGLAAHPLPWLILPVVAAYAAVLYRFPDAWLLALPAALPVFDLAPFTGRLLLDELDLLVLTTLMVGVWQASGQAPRGWPSRWIKATYALLWFTAAIAMARGLLPLEGRPEGLVASAHSPMDAWLVGKGLVWSLLLWPLLRRIPPPRLQKARRLLIGGLFTGLGLQLAVILWERHLFTGLTDLSDTFRVTGGLSDMRTGGAYIEAHLAFVFPILLAWILASRRRLFRTGGLAAITIAAYGLVVTYSRAAIGALVTATLVVLPRTKPALNIRTAGTGRKAIYAAAGLLLAAIAYPMLTGSFLQQRFEQVATDFDIRWKHWRATADILLEEPLGWLLGAGFGRYPSLHLFHHLGRSHAGSFGILEEHEKRLLRLIPGEPLYLDQIVFASAGQTLNARLRLRAPEGGGILAVALCRKTVLYSKGCHWTHIQAPDGPRWREVRFALHSPPPPRPSLLPGPFLRLTLFNPSSQPVDIDQLSLKTAAGKELVKNGTFDEGEKHWLFSADKDPAWHIHQQWLEIWFAQGLFGVLGFGLLLITAWRTLWPGYLSGDPFAVGMAGAIVAFLTVGLTGSIMDAARTSMLFYLCTFAAISLVADSKGVREADKNSP